MAPNLPGFLIAAFVGVFIALPLLCTLVILVRLRHLYKEARIANEHLAIIRSHLTGIPAELLVYNKRSPLGLS